MLFDGVVLSTLLITAWLFGIVSYSTNAAWPISLAERKKVRHRSRMMKIV